MLLKAACFQKIAMNITQVGDINSPLQVDVIIIRFYYTDCERNLCGVQPQIHNQEGLSEKI